MMIPEGRLCTAAMDSTFFKRKSKHISQNLKQIWAK